jgi:hypothetical protein
MVNGFAYVSYLYTSENWCKYVHDLDVLTAIKDAIKWHPISDTTFVILTSTYNNIIKM